MNIAIYPGSFDPFTNGHLDIVKKASKIFDYVAVVIAINHAKEKRTKEEIDKMFIAIHNTLKENNLDNCLITYTDGLVAEYAKEVGAEYIIRGLRNNIDFNYEENIAEVNKIINPDLEYVYFRADNKAISSSMVKELHNNGMDVKAFVPKEVMKVLNKK